MNHTLPKKVTIHDLTIRDGFQHEEKYFSTEAKIYIVNKLIDAGFKHIEVSNFAHPKFVPRFKDIEELLKVLPQKDDVEYTFVTVSDVAVERAIKMKEAGFRIDRIGVGISTSEKHNLVNAGKTLPETWKYIEKNIELAHKNGIKVFGSVMTIFGCPIVGKMPMEKAWEFTDRFIKLGIDTIEHSDHDGQATPDQTYQYLSEVMERQRTLQLVNIPVLCAASIVDGNGLMSALALGADGVTMGSRFILSEESSVHPKMKEWILSHDETDTMLVQRSIRNPIRAIKNDMAYRVLGFETMLGQPKIEQIMPLINGKRSDEAIASGDVENCLFSCGQSIGLMHDIPSVKEIIENMVKTAEESYKRLNDIVTM